MKRRDTVKSNKLFNEIIDKGKRNQSKYFVICRDINKNNEKKFGIAVGTKVGNSVVRNKLKRQIRNIIDNNYNLFQNNFNYIIICRKEVLKLSFMEMQDDLIKLLEKED